VSRSAEHILQVLDRGVMGVQVPHVNTAADARAVIEAVKFHPLGKRSLAAGTRAAVYDAHGTLADFVKAANEATLIAVQLEDREAIENIDELLAVDGIDVFFIGPSDLSQSMGHPGDPKAPRVAKAIDDTLAKIVAAGRTPGMPATAEAVQAALSKGVRYIYTHLPVVMGAGAKAYFKNARESAAAVAR